MLASLAYDHLSSNDPKSRREGIWGSELANVQVPMTKREVGRGTSQKSRYAYVHLRGAGARSRLYQTEISKSMRCWR